MDVALVGGAALGVVFGELFKAVREAKDTVSAFRTEFDQLSSTLARIQPIFDDIESFNRVLYRDRVMDRIREMMMQGVQLVKASAKVKKVNFIGKHRYSKKLGKLNKYMAEFFKVDAQAVMMRDEKKILMKVDGLIQDMKVLTNSVEEIRVNGSMADSGGGYFRDPQAPEVVIGGDAGRCFNEIKGKLLQDGFSSTVVSASGACGKTTLVTALCHDVEIKGKFLGNILFIPISKTPNLVEIVQREALRAGFVETRIESEERASDYLRQLLWNMGQKPLLIVLDDVWSSSEFILEKFVVSTLPNYKIIVTSRFEFPAFGPDCRWLPHDPVPFPMTSRFEFPAFGGSHQLNPDCRWLPHDPVPFPMTSRFEFPAFGGSHQLNPDCHWLPCDPVPFPINGLVPISPCACPNTLRPLPNPSPPHGLLAL